MVKLRIVIILFILTAFQPVLSQKRTLNPYDLLNIKMVAEVALSPDNKYIAYTVTVPRQLNEGSGTDYRYLYVYHIAEKKSQALIEDKKNISGISWSPDGKNIVFKALLQASKGLQLYSISPSGSEATALSNLSQTILNYVYFNNDLIYFTANSPQNEYKTELLKKGFDMEIYEEEYRDINLYELNLKTGNTRQITSNYSVIDFSVSPDGKFAIATITEKNLTDYSYMFKKVAIIGLVDAKLDIVSENQGKMGVIKWSPDGTKIAYIAASHLNDAVDGSLFVTDNPVLVKNAVIENIVKSFKGSVIDFSWKDNNNLFFAAEESVNISLYEYNLKKKMQTLVFVPGEVFFRTFSINNSSVAFAGNTAKHPNELFNFDFKRKQTEKLTNNNPFLDNIEFSLQEKISYKATDGLNLEGVLIYPQNYIAGKQYPAIVYIHGGPEACVQNGWLNYYSYWGHFAAAKGFFVFYPNYRASSGRGVDFTMAGFGDLLGKEFSDVIDGIDFLINKGMIDKNKVGIGGGSYGGYFAAWGATRFTDRFAASVVFVGVSNQVSKRFTTDIPYEDYLVHWGYWSHENWDKVFDVSPVKYAHQSKTPTLILHGKDDPRIPVSQGMELYRALKTYGNAPVRLVLYPGEGHGNRKNTSRLDYLLRTLEWFDYYLNSEAPKNQIPEKYLQITY